MSDEQRQQVQVAQAETSTASEPPKWGELPPPERIAELGARLAAWDMLPVETRDDPAPGEGRSAFDWHGPQGWDGGLSGADVFYVAARALAGSAEPGAIAAAAQRIRDPNQRFGPDFLALHLESVDLSGAHLEDANLALARLEGADLGSAHLERADLGSAHLERADLTGTHLQGASLTDTHLERASLTGTHLQGADLTGTHLQGADLSGARLQGANLLQTHLERANLRGASFDKTSRLNEAVLTGASFDQVTFDNTNLAVVDWSRVTILGDERTARERKDRRGISKTRVQRLADYKAAVRANRVLFVALQAQGLSEDASRFAYRAQLLQRRVLRLQGFRKLGSYLFSLLIAALAGYGYRLWRIVIAYTLVLLTFGAAYYVTGILSGAPLPWYHALLISFTAIHGRVFLGQFGLDSALSWVAGIEAVAGIVIEGVFVAMLIQRFFGR